MVRGKSLVLFLLVGLTALCLAGCAGDEKFSKNPTDDAEQASGGGTENPFGPGTAEGGIPIEGDEATAEEKQPAETAAKAAVIKPVEINKRSGSLGACVIGEPCERKISAKGGSGEYAWTLVEGQLPEGLDLVDAETKKVKIQKADGQEIDEIGDFRFKLKVEDQADAERSAERQFTLTIKENIAMALYTMGRAEDDSPVWTPVEENAQAVTVPPKGKLLVVVIGHAESYRWSIDGLEITCGADRCAGENEHIKLYKDTDLEPQGLPPHHQSIVIEAKESFIGQDPRNVVIAAADEFNNAASKTILSITFQQDPCTIPLTISGGADAKKKRGEEYSVTFSVSGGKAPYKWKKTKGKKGTAASDNTATYTVKGKISDEAEVGGKTKVIVTVEDSCTTPNKKKKTVTLTAQCRFAEVNHVEFNAHYAGGNSDTDVCNETEVEFQLFAGGKIIGRTGNIAIDTNDNDIIDDLSPTYPVKLDEMHCLEDIEKFNWWIDGDACWEYPDVFVDKVLVVAGGFYAGWKGSIGDDDIGDAKNWEAGFNVVCDETGELWCNENPWPGYRNWEK